MADQWTLEYGGEMKTLAAWGLRDPQLSFRNQAPAEHWDTEGVVRAADNLGNKTEQALLKVKQTLDSHAERIEKLSEEAAFNSSRPSTRRYY